MSKEIQVTQVSDMDILNQLFSAADAENVPEKHVKVERAGTNIALSFIVKGLRESELEKLEKRFTRTTTSRGVKNSELDTKAFNRAIIAQAVVAIGGNRNITFNHPDLLSKYQASGAEQVVKRVLLAGEISQLADVVLDLSGYYNDVEEEDLKNELPNED